MIEACEDAWWRSMEELVPVFEKEGINLHVEPHPEDWCETIQPALDIIRTVNSKRVKFLYCAPHTFYFGDDTVAMLRESADVLAHVHVGDTFNHKASSGLRYILNPPGTQARVHQHLNIGQGEVPWDDFFGTLAEIGFDGIMTACVFAWEDKADAVRHVHARRDAALRRQVLEVRSDMTVRIGVIGTGAIGRDHARRINQVLSGAEVVALSDVNRERAQAVKADVAPERRDLRHRRGADRARTRWTPCWSPPGARPTSNTSWPPSPPASPCFCEKPLATTAEGAQAHRRRRGRARQRLVQVGFMRRYDEGYRLLKQVVDAEHRRAADGPLPRTATRPCPTHYVTDDGDPRHADPRDRRVPLAARRRLRLGAGRSSRAAPATPTRSCEDPQIVLLETAKGVAHRRRGLRQLPLRLRHPVPGRGRGRARLACPSRWRSSCARTRSCRTPILTDWKDRFIASYDVELQDFLDAAAARHASPARPPGTATSPPSPSDACVAAQEAPGTIVPISLPARPALYD